MPTKKIRRESEKLSVRLNRLESYDQVNSKLTDCIKLAEDTLQAESYDQRKDAGLGTHWKFENPSSRSDRTGDTFSGTNWDNFSDSSRDGVFPQIPDSTLDQEFVDYLDELDYPKVMDDLDEWSDDIDLFMEGLCNPHKIDKLWQQSKAKKYGKTTYQVPKLIGHPRSTARDLFDRTIFSLGTIGLPMPPQQS